MKYDEVPKHKHRRALVLTARKLVRLVYKVKKDPGRENCQISSLPIRKKGKT